MAAKLIFDLHTLMMKPVTALIMILKSCLCIFLMLIKSLNVFFFKIFLSFSVVASHLISPVLSLEQMSQAK